MRSLVARIVRSPAESLSPHSLRVDERRDYPASLRNITDEATRAIAVKIRRLYGNNSIQEAREDSGIGTGRTRESGSENRATRFNKVQSRFRMNEQEKLPSNSFFGASLFTQQVLVIIEEHQSGCCAARPNERSRPVLLLPPSTVSSNYFGSTAVDGKGRHSRYVNYQDIRCDYAQRVAAIPPPRSRAFHYAAFCDVIKCAINSRLSKKKGERERERERNHFAPSDAPCGCVNAYFPLAFRSQLQFNRT